MIIALDIGNTNTKIGLFKNKDLCFSFTIFTKKIISNEIFLIKEINKFLKTKNYIKKNIHGIVISCVVISILEKIKNVLFYSFFIKPLIIQHKINHKLNLKVKDPKEIGSDRLAAVVAARNLYKKTDNLLIISLGTALVIDLLIKKDYFSGIIFPGINTSLKSLSLLADQIEIVKVIKPINFIVGNNTITNIQSGLYYGFLGAIKEFIQQILYYFKLKNIFIIGTGGMVNIFNEEQIFDVIITDLVLHGNKFLYDINK